jgi:hypothetical protein
MEIIFIVLECTEHALNSKSEMDARVMCAYAYKGEASEMDLELL